MLLLAGKNNDVIVSFLRLSRHHTPPQGRECQREFLDPRTATAAPCTVGMDTADSKKRPADSKEHSRSAAKRARSEDSPESSSPTTESPRSNDNPAYPAYPPVPYLLSIKDMLTVPLEYVFRQCPTSGATQPSPPHTQASASHPRLKPLLSRNEASMFIRVQTLAAGTDSLVQLSTHILTEKVEWTTFHDELVLADIPCMRCLLPILRTLAHTFFNERMQTIQTQLGDMLKELRTLSESLVQASQANWETAATLTEAGVSNATALEKNRLADIQDELARRIDSLVQCTTTDTTKKDTHHERESEGDMFAVESPKSMAQFCADLWKETADSAVLSPLRESASPNFSRLSIERAGKENEPSQHSLSSHSAVFEDSLAFAGASTQTAALALSTMAYPSTPK